MTTMRDRMSDAARFDPEFQERVRAARRRFLDAAAPPRGDGRADLLGDDILYSWERSRSSGVDPSGGTLPSLPTAVPRGRRLAEAATPVMARLGRECEDSDTWGLLLDRDCVQVHPIVGDARVVRDGEKRGGGVGAIYREQAVGTNGAGLSVERLEPFMVVGPEHYRESEHNLTSVGVPLRDAIGRHVGVLLMCHRMARANHLVMPYAQRVAEAIEEQLLAESDLDERVLFAEFSKHSTRPSLPVVGLSEQVFVANTAAQQVLRDTAHVDLVRETALEVARGGRSRLVTLELGGVRYRMHCRVVEETRVNPGVVLSLTAADAARGTRIAGTALPPERRRADAVRRARARGLGVLVVGERGAGRARLAAAGDDLAAFDGEAARVDRGAWLRRLAATLADRPVLIRSVDALDDATRAAALALVRDAGLPSAATALAASETLGDVFPVTVDCPPLRARRDELERLVTELLTELGTGDEAGPRRCAPEVLAAFAAHDWPGNVAQLRRVLATAVATSDGGDLTLADMPRELATARSGPATGIARVEREMVFEALRNAGWNRDAAAEALGISRATLYRKIKQFAFRVPASQQPR